MYWGCPGTLLGVTPYNVSILPRVMWVQCFCTAQGSVETLSLHCHSSGGQCGDIVPALPLIWGAVRRHCTRTAPGSTETIATGIAEMLYGVPPNNVPGQPRDIVRGYLRQCRGSLFCLPRLNWESFIPFTFLFPTEWRNKWESFKLERINSTRSARLPTSTPLGLLRHFPVLGSVTLT